MGGDKRSDTNSPANLVCVDPDCHRHIEEHRSEALSQGFLVAQSADPATWPIRHHLYGRVFLEHDG
jgi:hypothetical protein